MVSSLLNIIFFTAFFMCSLNSYANEEVLALTVDTQKIQYGKSFNLFLHVKKGHEENIALILEPLSTVLSFKVTNKKSIKNHEIYKIKSQAFHAGKITIPALRWKEYRTEEIILNVSAALAKNKTTIQISHLKEKASPWVREQNIILVNIITQDKNIILNTKNIVQPGLDSFLLKQSTKMMNIKNKTVYEHSIGWSVFFLYKQESTIKPPSIEYIKDGVPIYRFKQKLKRYTVKSLPIYVSPTIPVGAVQLSIKYVDYNQLFMSPNSSAILHYELISSNVPAKWLPSIAQLYSRINSKEVLYSSLGTNSETSVTTKSIYGMKNVDIAFTPSYSGLLSIDDIHLQYFDPKDGRLKNANTKHKQIIVINWFIQLMVFLIVSFFLYRIFLMFSYFIKKQYNLFSNYRRFFNAITTATSYRELHKSLKFVCVGEGWSENITLSNWLLLFSNKYQVSKLFRECLFKVNANLYSAEDYSDDYKMIQNVVYQGIKQRKRK